MDRVEYQSLIIQDIINLEKANELNVTPWYQRRSVWKDNQKSYLINTIFERKPIPAIYMRHSLDLSKGISIKEVVDGQQRTRAIIGYCNNEFSATHPDVEKKITFKEMSSQQRTKFLLTAIPIGYLLGANDADVIDIFARINSVSKTLNDQEKRNALWSGDFKQFCVSQSSIRIEFWKEYKIFTGNDISRMAEVQFISDLIVNMQNGLSNFSQKVISDFYESFDDKFPKKEAIKNKLNKIFDFIISLDPEVINQTIFNRAPIFFSLFLVLNNITRPNVSKVQKGLIEIDNRYNSDTSVTKDDIAFYNACSATTQGLPNRKIRDAYIRKFVL